MIKLGTSTLTPLDVWTAAKTIATPDGGGAIGLSASSRERIEQSAQVVVRAVATGSPIYGINTGVGALRCAVIESSHIRQFQINLLRSHACGTGDPLPRATVAAMWIHLLNSAAQGYRGIRLKTIETIIALLNSGTLPVVPSQGSVGASGDLAPSAHAALALIGEGHCTIPYNGGIRTIPAGEALMRLGLVPLQLEAKEALSLMNGTQLTTSYACQVWTEAEQLWKTATLALALSTFGFRATPTASRTEVLESHHPETLYAGLCKQEWFEGAALPYRNHNQDPYCFRCAPQVHGAVWKEIAQSEEWVTEELGAATENPIVLIDTNEFVHGGNFHAIYPARVLDRLATAMTQLASIAERRINLGMDSRKTGLQDFLTPETGLNSGLMMTQATAAALVSECKALSFPASVDTIPTNCDQEDHVSMGPIAGKKAVQICRNVRAVLAIEILAAIQAIHLRPQLLLPARLQRVYELLREHVPPIEHDRIFSEDIQCIERLIETGVLLEVPAPCTSSMTRRATV